jgi:hypothetical protein
MRPVIEILEQQLMIKGVFSAATSSKWLDGLEVKGESMQRKSHQGDPDLQFKVVNPLVT